MLDLLGFEWRRSGKRQEHTINTGTPMASVAWAAKITYATEQTSSLTVFGGGKDSLTTPMSTLAIQAIFATVTPLANKPKVTLQNPKNSMLPSPFNTEHVSLIPMNTNTNNNTILK